MKVISINGVTIPQSDIISISTVNESLDHVGDTIVGSQSTIVLNNVEGAYDERVSTSLFYSTDWYNSDVTIFDTEVNLTIFTGKIKKYSIDDTTKRVTITVNDIFVDMNDVVCICSLSAKTPAEVVYTILTDPDGMNTPEDRIVRGTFDTAIAYQASLGITIEVNYLAKDNIKVFDAIRTICSYTGAALYMKDNRIIYLQRKPYNGELGRNLYDKDIVVGSVRQISGDLPIYNAYDILYKTGSSVGSVSGVNYLSKVKYGVTNTFTVPQSGRSGSSATDYKALFSSPEAATAAGELILSMFAYRRTKIEFTLSLDYGDIMLGDIVIAQFRPYTNEPILVTDITKNVEKRTIHVKGELVNYYRTVALDTTPPDKPSILGCLYNYNQQRLYLEVSYDPTVSGYYVYVSRDGTFSDMVICGDKLSPFKPETFIYGKKYLYFMTPPTTLYIKIATYDQSNNISDESDVITVPIPGDVTSPQRRYYRTQGGIINQYLTIDMYNSSNDTPPEDITSYDDSPRYGVDLYTHAAVYDSDILYNQSNITLPHNPITKVAYRHYTNQWSNWTIEVPTPLILPKGVIQLRLYITPETWSAGLQYNYKIV